MCRKLSGRHYVQRLFHIISLVFSWHWYHTEITLHKPHMNGRGISKFSLGWMQDIFLSAFFSLPSSLVFLVWPWLSCSLECNVWTNFQSLHNHQSKTIYWVQLEPLKRAQLKELCQESYQNIYSSRNCHHFEWNK